MTKANDAAVIEAVLPRRTFITRAAAGLTSDHQTLAANVDVMFVVTSVNLDLNVNRLRRYVLLAMQGGVELVFVFSKMDLFDACDVDSDDYAELSAALNDVEATFPEACCIFASTVSGRLGEIGSLLPAGKTAVFLGSSGVGKSTLVNALLDADVQKTGDIRGVDQRGRHTIPGSELFFLCRMAEA
ncbi:MAG: GTPase RsgA [Candidatus Obscuribacterales bacterium]